jgi:hypothetical protein
MGMSAALDTYSEQGRDAASEGRVSFMRQMSRFRAESAGWSLRRVALGGAIASLALAAAFLTDAMTGNVLSPFNWRGRMQAGDQGLPSAPAAGQTFSTKPVSGPVERRFALSLEIAVPELNEVYFQRMADGGLAIFATGILDGYPHTYAAAADVTSRYLLAAYDDVPGVRVDFASLYLEYHGRYVMAAGLGREAAKQLALDTFAPDEGTGLAAVLARRDKYAGALGGQAYAQYSAVGQ